MKNGDREYLFKRLKDNISISWDKFYPRLNIGRAMFFNYLKGKYLIPEHLFYELEKIAKIKIDKVKKICKTKGLEKEISNPTLNTQLAEILGILNGDGYLSPKNYEISVVGDKKEKNHFIYMKKLFEKAFGIHFKIETMNHALKLRAYSKKLVFLLNNVYSLPLGKKKGKLRIPKQVKGDSELLRAYIRGLFDTDGCFHIRRKNDPVIEITSADLRYLSEVKTSLIFLGFHVAKGQERIYIYNKLDVKRFFNEVKTGNSKHLKRYAIYQNQARLV